MKKTILVTVALIAISFGLGYLANDLTGTVKKVGGEYRINSKYTEICYLENEKGYFDLYIKPKEGVNVTTEWDLASGVNYNEAYIIGNTKKYYDNRYKKTKKILPDLTMDYSWVKN